jgi:hypothetical protein
MMMKQNNNNNNDFGKHNDFDFGKQDFGGAHDSQGIMAGPGGCYDYPDNCDYGNSNPWLNDFPHDDGLGFAAGPGGCYDDLLPPDDQWPWPGDPDFPLPGDELEFDLLF